MIVVTGLLTAAPSRLARRRRAGASTGVARAPSGSGSRSSGSPGPRSGRPGILLISDYKLDASRGAASRDDLAAAASDARDAARSSPGRRSRGSSSRWSRSSRGNLTAARSAAGLAIDRAPGDWRPWAVAARIDARAGNLPRRRHGAAPRRGAEPDPGCPTSSSTRFARKLARKAPSLRYRCFEVEGGIRIKDFEGSTGIKDFAISCSGPEFSSSRSGAAGRGGEPSCRGRSRDGWTRMSSRSELSRHRDVLGSVAQWAPRVDDPAVPCHNSPEPARGAIASGAMPAVAGCWHSPTSGRGSPRACCSRARRPA